MRGLKVGVSDALERLSNKAQKLPAAELKSRLDHMAKESQMLEAAFECLSTGIIITDSQGVLRGANKSAVRLLSISLASSPSSASTAYSTDGVRVWDAVGSTHVSAFLRGAFTSGDTNKSDEFSVTSKSGNVRYISVAIESLVTDGDVSGAVITVHDVTERTKDRVMAHRLESLAELTNLAANMAHEIKNPLGAISIHVQLIQKAVDKARQAGDGLPDAKFLEEPLGVVSEEVMGLNNIVMQFLMAVRPVKASLEILDVCTVVQEMVDFVVPEFEKHGFMASAELPAEPIRLLIDSRLLKEAFINIAQNSLAALRTKFEEGGNGGGGNNGNSNSGADDGGRPGRFCIAVKTAGDECVITVDDNGCGMTGQVAAHIFEPYFTTKADGTGLGMTMVYKIIKEFNGNIDVKSESGNGTAFTIRLPLPQTGEVKKIEYKGGKKV